VQAGAPLGDQAEPGVGVRNYLIEGVSGAGKTAVADELEQRGYQAIHGDRELAYRGDPETGLPMEPETDPPTALWMSEHHIWDVEKVKAYAADRGESVTFFCGGSRNSSKFIGLFDGVVVLDVDRDTMDRRIDERIARDPTDFGGRPEERELIARLFARQDNLSDTAIHVDATAPVARVVDDILFACGAPKPRATS
jgi:adenylate kinase family enzyme